MTAPPRSGNRDGGAANEQGQDSPRSYDARAGEAIIKSGKYLPPRGEYLGRIRHWGLDVYENSPRPWKDALFEEMSHD